MTPERSRARSGKPALLAAALALVAALALQWARMARANRHWFGRDGVHPSGVGCRARARGIARVMRQCR